MKDEEILYSAELGKIEIKKNDFELIKNELENSLKYLEEVKELCLP